MKPYWTAGVATCMLLAGSAAARQKIVGLAAPQKSKQTQVIKGSPSEAARELVRRLREDARVI